MSQKWIRNPPTLAHTIPSPGELSRQSIGFLSPIRFSCFRANCQRQPTQMECDASQATKKNPFSGFLESSKKVFEADDLGREIAAVALPALLGLAADPLASLVDTAFIGQIGSVELAAVGVSISVFNLISKIFNIPLLNITTSYVAEDNVAGCGFEEGIPLTEAAEGHFIEKPGKSEKRVYPSVSSALFLGSSLGIIEALVLLLGAWPILRIMGILDDSPMRLPAQQYLSIRALGAPAVVVSLATQGVFRGFKDTKTPLYATVTGNIVNVVLDPILMFSFGYGVTGAAVATVVSQYVIAFILLVKLNEVAVLIPPDISRLGLRRFFSSGGLLFTRTIAILLTMTLATSMAAQEGVAPMAAHQICMQIWLAASLLSDSLALAGQAVIADFVARNNGQKVKEATFRVLQLGIVFGLIMGVILGLGGQRFSKLFTSDDLVIQALITIIPFAVLTQPINSMAFVFDGIFYGATDFAFAAYSMIVIGIISSAVLFAAPSFLGLPGVWLGLTVLMSLRMASGILRLGTATGPWQFLANESLEIDNS
ncbi:protein DETOXIFICATION 44, chloroplastic isoform X2 [Selaginella moellendorffii]|uniref:protein DETOXIFICATION 44, chloroplastic isoform X2 n=1 Tax=Selaginella moellendorffii TaxID=88036 RepID=UPI000D1C5F53|nr:protein DETOXIFICATION 44, chloroplastic isoform X2 [Selaginella moellendorffii]|eukprot:XP_024542512.1 protein DETOXIFICATION 44, chloroplastic isoform X2 [Selaginella moellendorffii]